MKIRISEKLLSGMVTIGMLILPVVSFAKKVAPKGDSEVKVAPNIGVVTALNNIANWLFTILLAVAVVYIIIAAFKFVTAGGDSDKVNKARDDVMYAMIGIAVAILAKGLVALVQKAIK